MCIAEAGNLGSGGGWHLRILPINIPLGKYEIQDNEQSYLNHSSTFKQDT